jgi:subtilisin family serine protease
MATRKRSGASKVAAKRADDGDRDGCRLVYLHGIGWQEPLAELRRLWDLALFGHELEPKDGGPSRMARWSDLLHPDQPVRAWTARRTAGNPGEFDPNRALADRDIDADPADAQYLTDGLLRRLGVPTRARPGKKVLPLPGFLRRPLARAFLDAFVGDAAAYLLDDSYKARIRARLAAELPDDDEDVVLVAHSLGTAVALEVLAERAKVGKAVNVRLLVTLGSPLGVQEVQDFLTVPLAVPDGVRQWVNFADPLDPVALDKGLGNDFEPNSHSGVRIEDRLIVNERTTRGNPHAALGYLADPKVRTLVAGALRLDPMGRFVVARDVAASLGEHDERQPVLIEVREPRAGEATEGTMPQRVDAIVAKLEQIVEATARTDYGPATTTAIAAELEAARIDPLRHFVAAHLLPSEVLAVTADPRAFHVYSVWKSTRKRKLVARSARALQADAAAKSYDASGQDVHWAVLDTGIAADHPHFATHGSIAAVWDCTQPGAPKRLDAKKAQDKDGHGTHVAGILAGEAEDKSRRGLAPRTKLHVYKVLDDEGAGEDAWIIKALDHIATVNQDHGAPVIHGLNLSLGGPFDSTVYGCGFSPICQELRRLWRDGVMVVVASGNEGKVEVDTSDGEVELNSPMSIGDPANLEECIAVGSVHADKPHLYGISGFSSRGPTADGRCKPDVVAPGERIESCNARWRRAGHYRADSGTSMAAPAVSGLLAAFLSVRREFLGRPDEVKALLLRTCTDLGRDRYHQGRGMPNLMKMLLEA